MSAATAYEILGYAASALVVLSLAMRSILRLRIIGLVGSVAFMVYGILIGSYPVAITN
ncbi:YgjV family protein, partial [bacterium]|nr:YgjV family protein [bacterium]